ncbi:MAG TPA: nicotinamide riboside transporter PnuC [Rhodanobacter sp.]|nr:nicotinamide riboside transporter PnuC [Rhodanobacter sp.]
MSWLEILAALTSAWAVWLSTQRRPWCWPVGLVSVGLYAWVFADARLYSDMLLQCVFAVAIVYGWYRWLKHLGDDGRVRVAALPRRAALWHIALGAIGALALGWFMHRHTNAALPWLDAALAAFSLVAQWWQVKRHVATWWLWIIVDVIYVGEYVYKDLYVTSVLYAGFVLLAAAGLRNWQAAAATQRGDRIVSGEG